MQWKIKIIYSIHMNHSNSPFSGPLYKQVKSKLLESIRSGEWRPGQAILSERMLAERYAVSIGTLRKAVDELENENILVRHQGRGTFVASHNKDRLLFYFFHIIRHDAKDKYYPEVELIRFEEDTATPEVAEKLHIPLHTPIFRYFNRLSLEGRPVVIDQITVAQDRFPGLSEKLLAERESTIYRLYQENFGVTVISTEERIRSVLSDDQHTEWLALNTPQPVLMIRRVAYTYQNVPVEWRVSLVDTRTYEYTTTLTA